MLKNIHYAHFGKEKCKTLARKLLYWPNMPKHIEDVIDNCDTCRSFQRSNTKEPMLRKKLPRKPWEILATDIFFLLGKQYVIIVDTYSKYIEIDKLNDVKVETTIKSLKKIFAGHGIPRILYSDSGTQYSNSKFKQFANEWSFKHIMTTSIHHQSNGLAERHIQTVKRILKKIVQEGKDVDLGLLQLRNIPIDASGVIPAELLYGRRVRNIIPDGNRAGVKRKVFVKELEKRQVIQKTYYDRGSKELKQLSW